MRQKILYFVPDCPVAGAAGNITRFNQVLSYLNNAKNCEVDFVSISDWGEWNSETIQRLVAGKAVLRKVTWLCMCPP